MNKESKLKARRTKLGKCSKEDLVEHIIRKDIEVSKLISKNKELKQEVFELNRMLEDTKESYYNKMKSLYVEYDEVAKKKQSLQKGFKKVLFGLFITSALFVVTLVLALFS